MMTYEQVLAMAKALGNDAEVMGEDEDDNYIYVEFNDFDGFDEEWNEIDRAFDNPEAVAAFEEMLRNEALRIEDDYYVVYHFDGFEVETGSASYGI